ncbi:MAG: alginate lyase family protein [Acidobacteriota bacterium]
MRSRAELAFRIAQEAGNLRMWLASPRAPGEQAAPLAALPEPHTVADALRGTAYARDVEALAAQILTHRFPLLGCTIETGPEIDWRRDYSSGISTEPRYFRLIPYLDAQRAGDHKIIWELNRHQHWVLLAQAFLFTGRREFLDEIATQFESWMRANPFLAGINWTSALEAAFRALSWTWVYHLTGAEMDAPLRRRFLTALHRHGRYIERNLSIYFSPNTHLLGEAVALHALGALFPAFPESARWAENGGRIVREQMRAQVREDGSHFEQSSYYHIYALDMFLFHAVLADTPEDYKQRLARMADYAGALLGPSRSLPFLGDDDGGRFFHPYGARDRFGRATLATAAALLGREDWGARCKDAPEQAAWWLGPREFADVPAAPHSKLYPDAGAAILAAGETHIVIDAGPFAGGSAGHSHSDTLSIVARLGAEEILIDPGTYTYVSDPEWRDRFRGSAAHNTVRVDGRDQATPAGPFRWLDTPQVQIREWRTGPAQDKLDATVRYGGVEHRRRLLFLKPNLLFILDDIAGGRVCEQFWHAGAPVRPLGDMCFAIGSRAALAFAGAVEVEVSGGWRSRALGSKEPAPVIRVSQNAAGAARFAALLDLNACDHPIRLGIVQTEQAVELHYESRQAGVVRFQAHSGA